VKLAIRIAGVIVLLLAVAVIGSYVHARSSLLPLDDEARTAAPGSFASLPEGRVHYTLHGPAEAPLSVLVHGFSTPSFVFNGLIEPLTKAGRRVLTYDHFGRGFSDRPDDAYDAARYERQLLGLLDVLEIRDPVDLVGYSMGGAIVTYVAARHPDRVRRVGLLAPAGLSVDAGSSAELLATPVVGEWLLTVFGKNILLDIMSQPENQGRALPDLVERYAEQLQYEGYLRALRRTMIDFPMWDMHDDFAAVGRHGIPVLSIWGKLDQTIPIANATELQRVNPNADIEVIENGTHAITYSEPEQVAAALVPFLSARAEPPR
jgi:pimeloyl-ACP methyl ester carboxylesterase